MNTQTIPLIVFFTAVVGVYIAAAPRNTKTAAEAMIARVVFALFAVGFAVLMLFFTEPH